MAEHQQLSSRVKAYRQRQSWTQAELAERAGISRAAVSAIEIDRVVPSVTAALALARTLDCSVEDLFGPTELANAEPAWAWPPIPSPCRYWHARVQGRTIHYPVEATAAGEVAHDGIFKNGSFIPNSETAPAMTLVLASCDPAAGLLAAEYTRLTGFRLLALARPSRQALSLLGQGLVHVAGVHFATPGEPDGNSRAVRNNLGAGYRLLRVARWQEGLSVAPAARVSTVAGALRAKLRWVGRQPGSAARQCLDDLRPNRSPPKRFAFDHRGVTDAVRSGWADIGVCHRLVSDEAGLRFFPLREEDFDFCYSMASEGDPRIDALRRVVRSSSYRRLLGEFPGYETAHTGEIDEVR
jgi:molybdate-binding protein/DNA-binding XRE family transcriptional regulator